jgi:hypothetical protein
MRKLHEPPQTRGKLTIAFEQSQLFNALIEGWLDRVREAMELEALTYT